MAKAMFTDLWAAQRHEAKSARKLLENEIGDIESKIDALIDRVASASSESLATAFESRIEKLERQKMKLASQIDVLRSEKGHQSDFIEPAIGFLLNPWNIYRKGDFAARHSVLRLTFEEPLRYCRDRGYRTAKISYPFKVLQRFSMPKCEMVGDPGIEPGMGLPGGFTVRCRTLQRIPHPGGGI